MGNVCPALSGLIGAKQARCCSSVSLVVVRVHVPTLEFRVGLDWLGWVVFQGDLGEFNFRSAELCLCLVPGAWRQGSFDCL